ncbi:hypothetical protein TSUD_173360 [Trifolium subterraneum]|nr:hypothetical protein TSUD_173360 [Trifolium subterraneum]
MYRFSIFQKAISPMPEKRGNCPYVPEMADRTREELDREGLVRFDAYILESDICVMNALLEEYRRIADTKGTNPKSYFN